eukprot:COSAG06_NODE_2121_length_7543_cov_5.592423_5_plen_79_part_00
MRRHAPSESCALPLSTEPVESLRSRLALPAPPPPPPTPNLGRAMLVGRADGASPPGEGSIRSAWAPLCVYRQAGRHVV